MAVLFRVLAMVVVALLVTGCETANFKQTNELKRTKPQPNVLLMPLDVELVELSAGGVQEPKAEWTAAARAHMVTAIQLEKEAKGLRLVEFKNSEGSELPEQLVKLNRAVGKAVMMHQVNDMPIWKLPSKQGKMDWSLGPQVQELRKQYDADYALFFYVRDSYSSPGRVAAIAIAALFGVAVPGGVQAGFATLVDLDSGDVVWINRLARGTGDLRTIEPAKESVKLLLTGFPQ
jgi:hypothetical protein